MIFTIHLALALAFFWIINWIGRHAADMGYLQLSLLFRVDEAPAFNFLLRVASPAVFVTLCAIVLYAMGLDEITTNLWRVALYAYLIRIFFNLALGRGRLLNWTQQFLHIAFGTGLAYLAYKYLVVPRAPLFPDVNTIGNELWIAIALFLYAILNNVRTSNSGSIRRKNRYIGTRFKSLKEKYGPLIEGQFEQRYMELVSYAILIYESFNRPWILRKLEKVIPGARAFGLMQVNASRKISDLESVTIGVAFLKAHLAQASQELIADHPARVHSIVYRVITLFNKDQRYAHEVFELMAIIALRVAEQYRQDYQQIFGLQDFEIDRTSI
jgi:hypothetical protein